MKGAGVSNVIRFVRVRSDEREAARVRLQTLNHSRPQRRSDCEVCPSCQAWRDHGEALACGHDVDEAIMRSRPCVFVGCRESLYLDVTQAQSIKLNYPELEPDELEVSCVLDVASGDPLSDADISRVMNLSRERVRQIEIVAFRKLERLAARLVEER
jgi:hypothetical protein